jgi:hypothetical protein
MNKFRDALVMARTTITSQQNRMTQMVNDLARAKQSRISNDLTGSNFFLIIKFQFFIFLCRSSCYY